MCTYCSTNKYRKIYENHIGSIPKEANGRTYEIHHIDGNHSNNDPSNLQAVTIQEHYDIHYTQGDFGACALIGDKMKLSPDEISNMLRLHSQQMIANKTHPFIGGEIQRKRARERVKNGTHHFLDSMWHTTQNLKRVKDGTHPFIGKNNPNNVRCSCIWCKRETSLPVLKRDHHEGKCQEKKDGTHYCVPRNPLV
jgi:hypothetical protein